MSRGRLLAAVGVGIGAILVALGVAFVAPVSGATNVLVGLSSLVVLAGLVGALWQVAGSVDDEDAAAPAWTKSGALAESAPERTRSDPRLSGTALAEDIASASEAARATGTVEDGVAVVRPVLREALVEALVQGGLERPAIERMLAEGTWTDDRLAAAVLDEAVVPPDRPLRRRIETWLFPERAVAVQVGRAVGAIAEATDDALPTIVGQRAPRDVPVVRPTLEELERTADDTLHRAAEPTRVQGGPGSFPRDDPVSDDDDAEPTTEVPQG